MVTQLQGAEGNQDGWRETGCTDKWKEPGWTDGGNQD